MCHKFAHYLAHEKTSVKVSRVLCRVQDGLHSISFYPPLTVNSTSVHDHELLSCPIRQVIMIALLWVCWQEINLLALLGCLMLDCNKLTRVCYPCPEIYLWEPNCYYVTISVRQSDRSRMGWVKAKTGVILIAILTLPNWRVKILLRPQVHSYFCIGETYFWWY